MDAEIARIQVFPLVYPEPHYLDAERSVIMVRVESDGGAVGWGEGITRSRAASLATTALVEQEFAPLLTGADATNIEVRWRQMCADAWWHGPEGVTAFAVSAIDMALWDLKGKLLGVPVANLLGGQVRTAIPAMASIIFDMDDLDWTLAEFQFMRDEGYRIVKAGWGMTLDSAFGSDRRRDLRYLTEIRKVIGDDISLVVDIPGPHHVWDVPTAIRRIREWESFDLRWVEQPLHPADLDGHRRLRQAISTPIGTGEDEWTPEGYRHVLGCDGVDVVQFDPGRCLGLTGSREVAKLVENAHASLTAHSWSGALNTAASLHLLATSDRGDTLDFKPHRSPMQHDLVEDPWVPVDGMLTLRPEPGLGVTVNEEALTRYGIDRA